MNNKTGIAVLVVVAVLVVGYIIWSMSTQTPAPGNQMATTTNQQGANAGTPAAGTIPAVGQKVPPAGSNAGTTFTAQVTITGFTSQNETTYPLVNYKVDSALAGNGFFSLIGQNTNTVVWGANQRIAGNYSLDPNSITVQGNEPSHKLLPGDYFIRIQDSTGKTIGESRPFRIAVGQVTGN